MQYTSLAIFASMAVIAAWSILNDLSTGVARDELYRFSLDTNPLGFVAIIGGKMFVIVFAIAMILHAFGLAGDPVKALQPYLDPFGPTPHG
jgi:hypothetical protein